MSETQLDWMVMYDYTYSDLAKRVAEWVNSRTVEVVSITHSPTDSGLAATIYYREANR